MRDDSIYQPQFSMQDVEIIEKQFLYQGFVQVESVTIRHRLFQNSEFTPIMKREIVHRREAAGVLVHDPKQQKFLLIEQFRAATINSSDTSWQLEIIAGLIDAGEDATNCLKREALEEANCLIQQLDFVHRYYPSAGASNEVFNFYVATANLSQSGGIYGEASEGENIKVHIFNYSDISALFSSGYLRNAPVIIALQWLQLYLAQHPQNQLKDVPI